MEEWKSGRQYLLPLFHSSALLLRSCLGALAGLAADLLATVADSFALVRLRLSDLPNLSGRLAYELLIDSSHYQERDTRRLVHTGFELDFGRGRQLHAVGITHGERQVLAGGCRSESDAMHFQDLFIPLRDAFYHVGQKRARQAVERAVLFALARPAHIERSVFDSDDHIGVEAAREGALRSFNGDLAALADIYFDALRNLDRALANS